jgi:hypothetical protein
MNKIVLNNKNLTFIAKELGKEFNKIEFLNWYAQINSNFKYGQGSMPSGDINKYFSNSKEHLKVFELPELEITNEKDFKKLLVYPHGSYREPLIKVLENEFGINYWEETLKIACEDKQLGYSAYYGLLSHSMNDWEFTEKNIKEIKKFIDIFVDSINNSKSKRFSEVLQYVSFAIPNKEVFGNAWLVATLNQIFKDPDDGSSKSFSFQVDKLSPQFMDLDFSGVSLYPELKKVLKGKLPLTKSGDNTKVFFIEIDYPRYCMQHKTVQQLLQTNCITGFDIIEKYLNDETDVLSHYVKRDKNKISLSVIHEDPKLNDKLNILVDTILNNTQLNKIVDKSDFEKALIYINLNDTMAIKNIKTKTVKV